MRPANFFLIFNCQTSALVLPEFTMISAGKENRYGHPHQEVLNRLEKIGSRIYCTKDTGAITIVTDGKQIKVI